MNQLIGYLRKLKDFSRTATARLGLSYLAIIMLMSIGFSIVFYNASAHELGRPGPRADIGQNSGIDDRPRFARDPAFDAFLQERAAEGRHTLLMRLISLNVLALIGGSALSYYLARRTLQPIEENMEAQAQFVSDASHELRTPLTALQTTNEVALRKSTLTDTDARDLFQHNVAEVAKLKALTDGLLRLAKPEHHLVRSPVSLQQIASDAMNALVSIAQTKNIAIEDNVPNIKVLADVASLVQVLIILMDNAIKYSHDKSNVRLTGGKQGKVGFISVIDEGQGISKHDLPHIFDRFYRADQSRGKRQTDGYGIGLALAKKIIHQLDGEIIASSTVGKGSTFTVRLPLA